MKILIYGAGVIGSIFAAKLYSSGQDVTVLARGKRLDEIRRNGVVICNPKTKRSETAKVKVIDNLLPHMEYDYIFVVMQRTQVDAVLECLSQNCTRNIVFVVNTAAGFRSLLCKTPPCDALNCANAEIEFQSYPCKNSWYPHAIRLPILHPTRFSNPNR